MNGDMNTHTEITVRYNEPYNGLEFNALQLVWYIKHKQIIYGTYVLMY